MRSGGIIEVKRVLVLNIGGIGDMVMATPALEALAPHVNGGCFDLLTVARSASVVEKAPFVRRIYTVDVAFLTGKRGVGGLFRLMLSFVTLMWLRFRRYDLAVDLMAMESSQAARRRKMLLDIIRPRRRAGRNTNGWAPWLDTKAPEDLDASVHEVNRKLSVLCAMGLDSGLMPMRVYTTDADAREAERLLETLRDSGSRGYAALVPGAYRPSRRWEDTRFVEVGNYLRERCGLSVGVFGASDERRIVSAVAGGIAGGAAFLDVPPRVLFEIFRRCAIIATNDTGPMHIAAAAERPRLIAVFGPEDPNRYAPYRTQGGAVVVFEKVDCSPCTLYRCDRMKCLKSITVDRVTEAVDLLMDTRGRTRGK